MIAVPPLKVALPSDVPPLAHSEADGSGPQTSKFTVPTGVPATGLPLIVTESCVVSPSWIDGVAGVEMVVLLAGVTVKQLVAVPLPDDVRYTGSPW